MQRPRVSPAVTFAEWPHQAAPGFREFPARYRDRSCRSSIWTNLCERLSRSVRIWKDAGSVIPAGVIRQGGLVLSIWATHSRSASWKRPCVIGAMASWAISRSMRRRSMRGATQRLRRSRISVLLICARTRDQDGSADGCRKILPPIPRAGVVACFPWAPVRAGRHHLSFPPERTYEPRDL